MKVRYPLKNKMVMLVIVFALIISGVAIVVDILITNNILKNNLINKADDLSRTAAAFIDAEDVEKLKDNVDSILDSSESRVYLKDSESKEYDKYISQYEGIKKTEEYKDISEFLNIYLEENNLESIHVIYIDEETKDIVYLADASDKNDIEPGILDKISQDRIAVIDNPELGIPAIITNNKRFGNIVTAATPIHNKVGKVIGMLGVDVSLKSLREKRLRIGLTSSLLLTIITLVTSYFAAKQTNHFIVEPILKLSDAAEKYLAEENDIQHHKFNSLNIQTNDEIEKLSESMKQMENNMNDYILDLLKTKDQLENKTIEAETMGKLATVDGLTGLRNVTAYKEYVEKIDESIRKNEAKFAVVMIDLNFLKKINDTYGHEKGDIALKNLVKIISPIFKRSALFRIGGDEFVAILMNEDYKNRDELINIFKTKIKELSDDESLEEWNRTSAAIGYALYEPTTDRSYNSVFIRADRNMYINKKKMKAERNN